MGPAHGYAINLPLVLRARAEVGHVGGPERNGGAGAGRQRCLYAHGHRGLRHWYQAHRGGSEVEATGFLKHLNDGVLGGDRDDLPATGAAVAVSEKAIPVFKTGKEMRLRLNEAGIGDGEAAAS